MLQPALVVAVDGPSGSGKSSTSRAVAQRLGAAYLDTGSMYRALTIWCDGQGIAPDQAEAVRQAAADLPMVINTDPRGFRVELDGRDITSQLHTPQVSAIVSGYAAIRPARDELSARMRQIIADRGRIVVEGRDITTVVAPDADVRILLQADPQRRIARRVRQLKGAADEQTVTDQVVGRDALDATSSDFEKPAPGVTLIDSSELDLGQVIDLVISLVPQQLRTPVAQG
ncbi:MAG: (d)CMP kinase [Brooklawnia sp.]|jgi:cytidylate kinase